MIKSNRGQLSIFMGITLILVMGMLAFIINVGLFVKAKINLQNAVDAAAFSGAATQARQLSNIAYLNWEIRNTFKEWMFKYYVLGQLGLIGEGASPPNNLTEAQIAGDGPVSFLLHTPPVAGTAASVGFDKYNVPSICVHNNSSTNICPLYTLPGIPRFPAIGVAGISEIHESFVNTLVSAKGKNCADRTQINFLAAVSWAYSSGLKNIPGAPVIAVNRAGAWPEALELAMRMRNLEMIVNRPPVTAPINFTLANQLSGEGANMGFNERPIKAFMSAYRNLSGGKYKNNGSDEFSNSFQLTEIAPTPFQAGPNTVSGMLIPSTFTYSGADGITALQKHYLDLQIVPVNYATMFTTFVPTTNEMETDVDGPIKTDSACAVSKSAIPVPGYILGFVKNPEVVTYYAVKGEAQFTGLFFPRTSDTQPGSFKLTAYAAAKPFGGRIGPRLFSFGDGNTSVTSRNDINRRSNSYISGLKFMAGTGAFDPGSPIPNIPEFWVNESSASLGGVPVANANTSFGIPNLIYDFESIDNLVAQSKTSTNVQVIGPRLAVGDLPDANKGLFHAPQFRALKKALGGDFSGSTMDGDAVLRALVNARQATKYDAANYLIPDAPRAGGENSNAAPQIGHISGAPKIAGEPEAIFYKLFAPLIGNDLLYKNQDDVASIVGDYMGSNEKAIASYLKSLLEVGKSIYNLPLEKGKNLNIEAAQSIHVNAGVSDVAIPNFLVGAEPTDPTCKADLASKFYHFFLGPNTQCGIVPLKALMVEYINKKNEEDPNNYRNSYLNKLNPKNSIMTAAYPSERQGTDAEGMSQNPLRATIEGQIGYLTRRNFYSTKFIPLANVFSDSDFYKNDVFMESDSKSPDDLLNTSFVNSIKNDSTGNLNNDFYKDF